MRDLTQKALRIANGSAAAFVVILAGSGVAHSLTADDVLNKMNRDQKNAYVAGVVEGLAQARWIADRPESAGMTCIHDWFYGSGDEKWHEMDRLFAQHPEKSAAGLLYVLIKQDCGG